MLRTDQASVNAAKNDSGQMIKRYSYYARPLTESNNYIVRLPTRGLEWRIRDLVWENRVEKHSYGLLNGELDVCGNSASFYVNDTLKTIQWRPI